MSVGLGILTRAAAVWLALAGAEVLHGVARSLILVPIVGDLRARQLGVVSGSLLLLAIAWFLVPWIDARSRRQLLAVGVGWAVAMLAFELALGRLMGLSWDRLASDHDVRQGGLLPFGLLALAVAPLAVAECRAVLRRG